MYEFNGCYSEKKKQLEYYKTNKTLAQYYSVCGFLNIVIKMALFKRALNEFS